MNRIQISTVKQEANVEVININAYLVAKIVRAQMVATQVAESKQYCGKDDNDKEVWEYTSGAAQVVDEQILPLLNELVEAFGIKDDKE